MKETHTIAVFYYTQSGQALDIAKSITSSLESSDGFRVVYKEIVSLHTFPFPWSAEEFFDAFPESRLGLPVAGIEEIDFSDVEDASLIIIAGQSWFLSPSLPLQAFFTDAAVRRYLKGRNVVFVNGCRNMWLMTMKKIRASVEGAGARMAGHIVMQDKNPNLISVATIVRWLIYGRKERHGLLPQAGVADTDIAEASRFGRIIGNCLETGCYDSLQQHLVDAGAIHYKPAVLFLEKAGHRMFGLWAAFIRQKGDFGNKSRRMRCRMFLGYLLFVLYVISPFATLLYRVASPFINIRKQQERDCLRFGCP